MKALSTLLIFAALAGVASAQDQATDTTAQDLNPQVMTVNGDPVYAAEVSLVMRTIADNLRTGGHQPSEKEILGAATQRVIEQKLLAQEARRFGLHPDEARVEAMVAAAAKQVGGRDQLAASLAKGGSSIEQLTAIYREVDLGRILIARQIRPTAQVTDQEVTDFMAEHPELFENGDGEEGSGAAMPPEEARRKARTILVNQETAKLVSDLLKTLYDGASIVYPDEETPSAPSASPTPDPSRS